MQSCVLQVMLLKRRVLESRGEATAEYAVVLNTLNDVSLVARSKLLTLKTWHETRAVSVELQKSAPTVCHTNVQPSHPCSMKLNHQTHGHICKQCCLQIVFCTLQLHLFHPHCCELVTWAVSGESCWSLLLFLACVSGFFLRIMQSNLLLLFLGQPARHLFSVTSAPFVNFLTIHQLCRIELLWGSDAWCSLLCPNKRCVTFCLTSLVSAFCALTTNKLFVMDV